MDKCRQGKCCLDKSQTKHKINMEYFIHKFLAIIVANNKTEVEIVQIGKALSLKWTGVAGAGVAWIRVELKFVLEAPGNLRLGFGRGLVGNS